MKKDLSAVWTLTTHYLPLFPAVNFLIPCRLGYLIKENACICNFWMYLFIRIWFRFQTHWKRPLNGLRFPDKVKVISNGVIYRSLTDLYMKKASPMFSKTFSVSSLKTSLVFTAIILDWYQSFNSSFLTIMESKQEGFPQCKKIRKEKKNTNRLVYRVWTEDRDSFSLNWKSKQLHN